MNKRITTDRLRTLKSLLTLFLLLFIRTDIHAQIDKEFWFVAPEVSQNSNTYLDRPIILRITTYDQAAAVTISQPANGGMPIQNINIAANSTQSIDLTKWIDKIENKPANTILNYGIRIVSTAAISAYYEVVSGGNITRKDNPEVFSLKGKNALGTDFWIPSQTLINNSPQYYTPLPYSAFDIVATENNTTVTITPSQNIVGHTAGSTFTVKLNQGQSYSATAAGQLAAQHLSGSRVTSDKPVAVTVKDDLLYAGTPFVGKCADLGGDQIVPTSLLDTQYVAVSGNLNGPGDYLFVTATQNNTQIFKNGTLTATLNAGQTQQIAISGNAAYIKVSHPSVVWQLSGDGCEVGLTQLPGLTCTGSNSVSYVRSNDYVLLINIAIAASANLNGFTVNNNANVITAANFNPVPGTGGQWMYAQVSLPVSQYPQNSVIKIVNSTSTFQIGVLDGSSGGMSYGYFSNYGNILDDLLGPDTALCEGQSYTLNAGGVGASGYSWNTGATDSSITVNTSGKYWVALKGLQCASSDTINIDLNPIPVVDLGKDTSLCNTSLTLQSSKTYTNPAYHWNTGATNASIKVTRSGKYFLDVTENGCTGTDSITVDIRTVTVDLGKDTAICPGKNITLQSSGTFGNPDYVWNNGATTPSLTVNQPGTYTLSVTDSGCTGSDSIVVGVAALNVDLGPDTTICNGQPYTIGSAAPYNQPSYTWNTGATTPTITVDQSGIYKLTVEDNGCTGSDSIKLNFPPPFSITLGSDTTLCNDEIMILKPDPEMANASFKWSTGATTSALPVSTAGSYWLQVTDQYGCSQFDSIKVSYIRLEQQLGKDIVLCKEEPIDLTLKANVPQGAAARWNTGATTPNLKVSDTGTYWVRVSESPCFGTDTITVRTKKCNCEVYIPNAFSPNGDGMNDIFRPILDIDCPVSEYVFRVFNRWGQQVYFSQTPGEGWDGRILNRKAELGTYMYFVSYTVNLTSEKKKMKGDVILIR